MKINNCYHISRFFLLLLFFSFAASSAQAEGPAAVPDWFYHTIIDDLNSAPEGAVIIDSRPGARKYIRGHIPGSLSIPFSEFDKLTDRLPQDKATPLVFYCGGLKCKLSHKSAVKAEALGYKNVQVYANGYPHWVKQGNVGAVTVEYIKKIVAGDSKVVLIDSRPKKRKYDKGHIPGAVSLPDTEFEKQSAALLPEDKSTPLIFYCGGIKCKLSMKSSKKALAAGYTNVRYFPTGFPSWKEAGGEVEKGDAKKVAIKTGGEDGTISIDSFTQILKQDPESIHVIDVRDADEFAEGRLEVATNIPMDDLGDKVDSLPSDKPIVFLCSTGARGGEAYDTVTMLREDLKVYFLNAEPTYNADGSYSFKAVE